MWTMWATSANCLTDQLLEGEATAPRRVEALLEVINHEKTEKVLKLLEKQLNQDDPKRKLKLAKR